MDTPTLMSTREVAHRLGVSVPTVTRLAREERLVPAQKLDGLRGAYLFDPADVGALADELATPAPETTDATDPLPSDGAPAGGRAGIPEPAPASTKRLIARPRVRVQSYGFYGDHIARCEHCEWTYINVVFSDVQQRARWHRDAHRAGSVEVSR